MIKLLRANFFKMFSSWSFWLTLMLLPFINVYTIIDSDKIYRGLFPESGLVRWNIGQCGESVFGHLMFLTYIIVILVGMLIGDEYASGSVRNKIIAGYSRLQIYVSYLITSITECIIVNLFSIGVAFTICAVRYGFDTKDTALFAKMVLISLVPVAALAAFTLFCIILAGERTPGMVIAFLSDLVIYYFFDWFFVSKLINDADKLSDMQKKIYLTIDAILPSSYAEWLYVFGAKSFFMNIEHSPKCWWCCMTLAVMAVSGAALFRKTDLK